MYYYYYPSLHHSSTFLVCKRCVCVTILSIYLLTQQKTNCEIMKKRLSFEHYYCDSNEIWYHKNMDPICIHSVPIISNTFDVKTILLSSLCLLPVSWVWLLLYITEKNDKKNLTEREKEGISHFRIRQFQTKRMFYY